METKDYEYKSIRITASEGCLVLQKLIDISLNEEAKGGWILHTIFPHSCSLSNLCIVAIFQRKVNNS